MSFAFVLKEMKWNLGEKRCHAVKLSCTSNSGGLTFVKSIGIWYIK